MPKEIHMVKKRAIYYDTETTGIRFEQDRIIELAAYDPEQDRTFSALINPGIPIPPDATAIHHITDEMVASAPSFKEVGADFIEFCGTGTVLLAHNNHAFDKKFLEAEFSRNSLVMPAWEWFDTLKWARKYRNDLPKHGLQVLREVYGIEENQAHRALDDVMVLYQVFSQMIDDLPIETLLSLMEKEAILSRMPFGKHQGKALKDVPKNYVSWLQETGAFDKEDNFKLRDCFIQLGYLPALTPV